MNKLLNIQIVCFLFFSFFACKEDVNDFSRDGKVPEFKNIGYSLPIDDYVAWISNTDNGLNKQKEISDLEFNLSYISPENMTYLELKNEEYNTALFKQKLKDYSVMSYFNFKIKLKSAEGELLKYNLGSVGQYDYRIKHIAFNMQKDIFIVQDSDTLYPGIYHFERIYDIAPYATVMIAFDNSKFKKQNEFTIVYNDRLFNKGLIKYNYKANQLVDLPNLAGI
jgi:hypothetical protein